ncbi:MAG: 16S rRNA (guanine(527)-N(7))-methyltransferase RsmG [Saccharofermentanales bacterium]
MKDIRYYAEIAGIDLSDEQYSKFRMYEDLLLEWNQKMNLTAITLPEEIALKHFADSISVIPYLVKSTGSSSFSMIDIGSGAGFPGVPVKIMCPGIDLTLMDSHNKKISFLDEVIKALDLSKCAAIHSRAEDSAKDGKYRERFDVAIARAVSGMPVLCEYCLPYVKTGGIFVAMKTDAGEELESAGHAIRLLGGEIEDYQRFLLPGSDINRSVVIIRKISKTPAAYPRKAGKPEKEPLMKHGKGN